MERRLSPRIEVNLPVDVLMDNGEVLSIPSIDISYMGVSFNCDYWTVQQLFPEGHWSGPKDRVTFNLSVPLSDEFMVACDALVTRFLRLSENEYHIGVQFLNLDDETQHSLIHHVNQYRDK